MLASLQTRFAHPNVHFSIRDQLVLIELNNDYGTATLTPYGGTLLSYVPKGGVDVLWVSDTAVFDGSKPVRGGVPVCWPWFGPFDAQAMGPDPSDAAKKAHGFARYETWEMEAVSSQPNGATQVTLSLLPNAAITKAWPHDFKLSLVVTLGEALQVDLIGQNRSTRDWIVSEALHTYFRVGEAEGLAIRGLEGLPYIDKQQGQALLTQTSTLRIAPPLDCVFLDHHGATVIEDIGHGREIEMTKAGSASTVVWNPGPEGVKAFADMPDDQYHAMVCVEAGNALKNRYTLKAGATHTLSMILATRACP
jgi:glucose-6-phosphate 1-epimerase